MTNAQFYILMVSLSVNLLFFLNYALRQIIKNFKKRMADKTDPITHVTISTSFNGAQYLRDMFDAYPIVYMEETISNPNVYEFKIQGKESVIKQLEVDFFKKLIQ